MTVDKLQVVVLISTFLAVFVPFTIFRPRSQAIEELADLFDDDDD